MTLVSPNQALAHGGDEPFSSPLLGEVIARFDLPARHVILLPGASDPGILTLLQGKRCRILVADSAQALSEWSEESSDAQALSEQMERLIISAGTEMIDTVLCWDLLNYLNPPLLKAFAERLASIMAPEGIVHAYIHSASSEMPQSPKHYRLDEEGRVLCISRGPALRKTPRYSYADLEKHATGFRVMRSMLLRNGIQEYLLRLNQ